MAVEAGDKAENHFVPPGLSGSSEHFAIEGIGVAVKLEPDDSFPAPPLTESSDARRLIRYYCLLWKDRKLPEMYGVFHDEVRSRLSLEELSTRLEADAEFNGGLINENILEMIEDLGTSERWRVQLIFQSARTPPRTVDVVVRRTPQGYRLMDVGIIPIDLTKL